MILNTGNRTDIPAFYSEWFYNRIREGYVMTRNPYYPEQVLRYRLDPEVVDILCFCTKNPEPMLGRLGELDRFRQFWFVTITPYGRDVEPYVPEWRAVTESFCFLSERLGREAVSWRYDPIFISKRYPVTFHLESFEKMAERMEGAADHCVISFIDLYEKTKRNFPGIREVRKGERADRTGICADREEIRDRDPFLLRGNGTGVLWRRCVRVHDKRCTGEGDRVCIGNTGEGVSETGGM